MYRFFQYNDKIGKCGLFAIAFAAEILDGASPIDDVFDVKEIISLNYELQYFQFFATEKKKSDGIFISVHLTVYEVYFILENPPLHIFSRTDLES